MTPNYALAQALWLKRHFTDDRIRPEHVAAVKAVYDPGYVYSSVTFEDPSFSFRVVHDDGAVVWIDIHREVMIDLAAMVVEGLELEREWRKENGLDDA